jgi:hypothetical protein
MGGVEECTLCDPGYACPPGAMNMTICPVGSYSSGGVGGCTACTPGWRCPEGSSSSTPAGAECPVRFARFEFLRLALMH